MVEVSRYFSGLGSIFKKALDLKKFVTAVTDRRIDTHTEKVTTITLSRMHAEVNKAQLQVLG